MARRGAPKGVRNGMRHERAREAIKITKLVQKLQKNALGELVKPMTPSQIRSAEIILRKALPDLSAATIDVNDYRTEAREFSDAELAAIIDNSGGAGIDEEAGSADQSPKVH